MAINQLTARIDARSLLVQASLLASPMFAGACSSESDYQLLILFEPEELRASYDTMDLYLLERCEGLELGTVPPSPLMHRTLDASITDFRWLEGIDDDRLYGLYVLAPGDCTAAGCQDHVFGSEKALYTVNVIARACEEP